MQITPRQRQALSAMCDALIPSISRPNDPQGYWKRKASDLYVSDRMLELVNELPEEDQQAFRQLLNLISYPTLGLSWLGPMKSAAYLSLEERESLLRSWAGSPIPSLRKAFNTLKKLCGFFYFGWSTQESPNPNWSSLGYPGPIHQQTTTDAISGSTLNPNYSEENPHVLHDKEDMLLLSDGQTLYCDSVVIGSGAGGGVVAAELAAAGDEVIVLEKGHYVPDQNLSQREVEMMGLLYERKGAFTSLDGGTTILAGSCFGGGTAVNWAASLRTPDYILHEWATEHNNPQFLDPSYKKCFDIIEARTHTHSLPCTHNHQNQSLINGAQSLGYHTDIIPRNQIPFEGGMDESTWRNYGFSCLGDSQAQKMGTHRSFLLDAIKEGAVVLTQTEADRIVTRRGIAHAVLATHTDSNGQKISIRIRAKRIVCSAGSLHTPTILLRSGLSHAEIGKNLYLHPTVAVTGKYIDPVLPWYGPMMSALSDQFTRLDGNFGYKLETPPVHPGLMGLSASWESGRQYKQSMLDAPHLASFVVLTRDRFGGQVIPSKQKQPLVRYNLSLYDRKHLLHGIQEAVKIHHAAGAEEVRVQHNQPHNFFPRKDYLTHYLQKLSRKPWQTNHFLLFSAHQMGSCRMGGGNIRHPIKPNGETREIKNLFVADASLFPQCSGVNPMLSVQALSFYVAQHLI